MADYAARLSEYKNKGVCGLPESFDSSRVLQSKIQRLHEMICKSKHTVIFTGAGISTSAGIPDFRGPKGVWTLEKSNKRKRTTENNKKKAVTKPQMTSSFEQANPTLTHRAIAQLIHHSKAQFCITQNVDGLHRRSGLDRQHLAVLHGCVFTEKCHSCHAEYFRDFDVGGMSFQKTGRHCDACDGALYDTLLDWEDELPEREFQMATEHCCRADLVICLGTSLRINPAGCLPLEAKQFASVNLQVTPKDKHAALIIRARVDTVMERLLELLKIPIDEETTPAVKSKTVTP